MKTCTKCGVEKPLEGFYIAKTKCGHMSQCKICKNARSKNHYNKNKASYHIRRKRHQKENPEKWVEYQRKSKMKRRHSDKSYALLCNLRRRMSYVLKRKSTKMDTSMNLIGCSREHLKQHIEAQFTEGMTWDNYGKWSIDHIIPCSSFNLSTVEEQRKMCHYTNLQPLWHKDNIKKSNNISYNMRWNGQQWEPI